MKIKLMSIFAIAGMLFFGADVTAKNMNNAAVTKPISKVSDVNNMPEDATVYIQGYIIQNLGNENYVFKDNTGTINIEIDDDLLENGTITPEASVFITATVGKDGNITSLEAEEIQFIPADRMMSDNSN